MTNSSFKQFLRDSVRVFFAPAFGAYRQMRYELRRIDRDLRRNAHQKSVG